MTGSVRNDPFDTGFDAEDDFTPPIGGDGWASPAAAAGLSFNTSALGNEAFRPASDAPIYDPFAEDASLTRAGGAFEDFHGSEPDYEAPTYSAGPRPANPVADMQADIEASLSHAGVPRIAIHLFCERPETAALAEFAMRDRRLSRAARCRSRCASLRTRSSASKISSTTVSSSARSAQSDDPPARHRRLKASCWH